MKANRLLSLIQSSKLAKNNKPVQLLHSKDIAMKSHKLALVKSRDSFPPTSLNWGFLVKQCDRLCQFLIRFIETSPELKVNLKCDRQGRSHFEIYDPLTKKYHYFDSEQNAIVWLDRHRFENASQRRYQQFTESYEELLNKNTKSFDYFGRR